GYLGESARAPRKPVARAGKMHASAPTAESTRCGMEAGPRRRRRLRPPGALAASQQMKNYECIVIGLGGMGSAAGYHLARRGSRVLGIDRYSPPHARGSSHGDTRITRLAIGDGAQYTPLAMRSHTLWRDLE